MTNAKLLFRMQSFRSKWWSSVDLKSTPEAFHDNVTSGPVVLRKINRPDLENLRHRENSLKLRIFEAKRLPAGKKRYYCEICLDHILYARTTGKEKTSEADPFWGESFEFNNLQDVALITIRLYRETTERSKRQKKTASSSSRTSTSSSAATNISANRREPLGEIELAAQDVRSPVERWFTLQLGSQTQQSQQLQLQQPSLRVRAHFLSVDVLPIQCYRGLGKLAAEKPLALVAALEPNLQLRAKEDLAARLVSVAHSAGGAETFLAELIMAEITNDSTLLLRGNSVATKAVEFYLKFTGASYLKTVLGQPILALLSHPGDLQSSKHSVPPCEIDPQRVSSPDQLAINQRNLIGLVESFWLSVRNSADLIPPEIARLFATIRKMLADAGRSELGDNLVSGSLFLRLICPAILGPSLFGLCTELPSPKAARALTLVAKAIQHLANSAEPFGAKEPHMRFMNRFIEQQGPAMRLFLRAASRPAPRSAGIARDRSAVTVDLGYELAQLHNLLNVCIATSVVKQDAILSAVVRELGAIDRCLETEGMTHAADVDRDSDADWVYSNISDCAESTSRPVSMVIQQQPQQQQMNQATSSLHEDWQRVLDEAQSFATATGSSSSGYHSFITPAAEPPADTPGSSESPAIVEFYNPSYRQIADNNRTSAKHNSARRDSLLSADLVSNCSQGSTDQAVARLKSNSLGPCGNKGLLTGQLRTDSGGDITADFMPSGRVRMGIRARQHQSQAQPQPTQQLPSQLHQPSAAASTSSQQRQPKSQTSETDLQKLQRELTETRRRLQATEARLRSNETEKAELMAQFQQHHHKHQQLGHQHRQQPAGSSYGDSQMVEIMHRLRSLESSLQRQSAVGAAPKTASCLRGNNN